LIFHLDTPLEKGEIEKMNIENEERMYWAYRHVDGHIHVKRFSDRSAVEDAYESDFVDDVTEPFLAKNRAAAEGIAKRRMSVIST